MLKDPLMQWEQGIFPYDALAEAGITPESSMREIQDAYFAVIEKGLWTPEARAAWDELRTIERRLWVDLFLYPMRQEEILTVLKDVCNKTELALPNPATSKFLRLDGSELQRMEQDFRDIEAKAIQLEWITDFDEPVETILGKLEFDTPGEGE